MIDIGDCGAGVLAGLALLLLSRPASSDIDLSVTPEGLDIRVDASTIGDTLEALALEANLTVHAQASLEPTVSLVMNGASVPAVLKRLLRRYNYTVFRFDAPSPEYVVWILPMESENVMHRLIHSGNRRQREAAWSAALTGLASDSADERGDAILALLDIDTAAAPALILPLVRDGDSTIRAIAIEAIVEAGAVDLLDASWPTLDREGRIGLIEALGDADPRTATAMLERIARQREAPYRDIAEQYLNE